MCELKHPISLLHYEKTSTNLSGINRSKLSLHRTDIWNIAKLQWFTRQVEIICQSPRTGM